MKEVKRDTIVFKGLGFPIRLVNVPMKKILGEWVIDINFNLLQVTVLNFLARKPFPLSGNEIRFIIDYLELSTRQFAQIFGVSHTAVLKWEKEESKMNPNTEIVLRLYLLNHLNATDKEFRKFYLQINPENFAHTRIQAPPLEIDLDKIAC